MKVTLSLHEIIEMSNWAQDQYTSIYLKCPDPRCVDIIISEEVTILFNQESGVISSRPKGFFL